MKRSSSKLISKASSIRNINKQGYKFKMELHIESVDKMMSLAEVCVTWERRAKVMSTQLAKIDRSTRTAHFGGQILAQEITLFKKKKEESQFEDKVFTLAVRQGSERGKIIGKIPINFAEYVDIPSYSKRIGAAMSSGGRVVMKVVSTYLGEVARKKGSRGTGSIGSSAFESDAMSSSGFDDEQSDIDTDLNDLDDLNVADTPPVAPQTTAAPKKLPPPPVRRQISAPAPPPEDSAAAQGRMFRRPSAPSPKRNLPKRKEVAPAFDSRPQEATSRSARPRPEAEVGATNGLAPSRAEFEKLRRENRNLRRRNEDLQQQNDELEDQRANRNSMDDNAGTVQQLMIENTSLRRDLGDLEAKLSREPVYNDVVRDLREAKMALAMLTLERDQLSHENRKMRKGR